MSPVVRGRRLLYMLCCFTLAGCYTLQRVQAVPQEGTEVAFDISDAGRVALAERVGAEVLQLEGRLISVEEETYVIGVSSVRFLRGGEQVWRGERVRVASSHVLGAYERKFSKGKTAALTAITVGGAAAFFAGRSLLGLGSERNPGSQPDTGSTMIWPPIRITPQ